MPRYALAAAVLLALVAGASFFLSSKSETSPEIAAPAAAPEIVPGQSEAPSEPMRNRPTPPLAPAALGSPEETLQTQVKLLFKGDVDRFRETLMPAAQRELTREAFYGCVARVKQSPLSPEPLAGEATVDGKPVKRVKVMGQVEVAFDRVDGRWLAETLWCKPAAAGPTSEPGEK